VSSSRQSLVAIPTIALLAMSLAACGGGSDGAGSGSSETASPLGDLLGWNDYDPVESRREQLAIEEAVSTCMREEGFEYQPVDYEAQNQITESDEDIALSSDPEAYGKKYGYGVVRNYELYELPYIGEEGEGGFGGGQEFEDPNQEYVTSLSPDEQEAYYAELYGEPTEDQALEEDSSFDDGEVTEASIFVSPPLEEQGCFGKARLDIVGVNPAEDPDVQAALNEYFENSQDDPRIDQANAEWLDCMAEPLQEVELPEGMTVEGPDSVYQVMDAKKSAASGLKMLALDPETGEPIGNDDDEPVYTSFQNEDGTGFASVGEQKAIPADELERLRSFELKLWAEDWECQKDAELQDLRREIEQDAADDLVAQFPELAAGE
jgi:hypothetical protein